MSPRNRPYARPAAAALALALIACDSPSGNTPAVPGASLTTAGATSAAVSANPDAELISMMDNLNVALAGQGTNYRAAIAEYVTDGSGGAAGGTVLSKVVGNKQLSSDFVPNDPNRSGWSGPVGGGSDDITYAVDQVDAVPLFGGLSAARTTGAIDRAMASWDALSCSDLPITRNPDFGLDLGLVAFLNGLGGGPFIVADVMHAGFTDINFAGGILGVTFTFIFVDGSGVPTDVDHNGKLDAAFREIYYDPSWNWADDGVTNIDVETVAVHESGHGLSQAHFGKVWIKNDGSLAASPRAVMNALYASPFRALTGTDNGGHCSNWAQWPNN